MYAFDKKRPKTIYRQYHNTKRLQKTTECIIQIDHLQKEGDEKRFWTP